MQTTVVCVLIVAAATTQAVLLPTGEQCVCNNEIETEGLSNIGYYQRKRLHKKSIQNTHFLTLVQGKRTSQHLAGIACKVYGISILRCPAEDRKANNHTEKNILDPFSRQKRNFVSLQ
ncbi:hypothetical protein J6590_045588 [Homalodisca vitripennis]|nr:hypothetical protein J6590_045588 [Homalodisca vitripennis]